MEKVMVFGKPGGGKSTFSQSLARIAGLQLFALDQIEYRAGGDPVGVEDFLRNHDDILASRRWLVDGLGPLESFWQRLEAADTLIYIDLPKRVHYWRVCRRFITSPFSKPVGWPQRSPMIRSTLSSLRNLRHAEKFWNEAFLQRLHSAQTYKRVHHIQSRAELESLLRCASGGLSQLAGIKPLH